MKTKLFILIIALGLTGCKGKQKGDAVANNTEIGDIPVVKPIESGKTWYDVDGDTINAHGGGFLKHNDTIYWYGEIKSGRTWQPESTLSWNGTRVDAKGVNCYSSTDMINWKHRGNVLPANTTDSSHDLHTSKVIERPKVIYNEKTNKFVMWLHIDSEDYSKSTAGIAVSDSPTGPFTYIESMRPNNAMSRDQTLFKDDDGTAYHFYASESNMTMYVSKLTEDYLKPTGEYERIFIDREREAPAIFKKDGKYYAITSGCTGWDPNPAEYAVADHPMGPWEVKGDPCVNDTKGTTFDAQSTYVLEFNGQYIFMADRWKRLDLEKSTYVWLPLTVEQDQIKIEWKDSWNL